MQTFKEVKRTATHVTYRYQSIMGWLMYGILAGWLIAIALNLPRWIELNFVVMILAYFVGIYLPSRARSNEIKKAMRTGMVQMTGSRWSFANPLEITVPLTFIERSADEPSTEDTGADK